MKIAEALQKRNKLQRDLVRKQHLRQKLFNDPNDDSIDFDELDTEIISTHADISDLKFRIMRANINTLAKYGDNAIFPLQQLILRVSSLKSELAEYMKLAPNDEYSRRSRRYSKKEEEEIEPPLTESEIQAIIDRLESEKAQLNRVIQSTNWSTDLE